MEKKCKRFSKEYPIPTLFSEVTTWNFPLQVNNNCATGSSALYLAKQLVEGGEYYILILSEIHGWFTPDVIAAKLKVNKTKEKKVFWEFVSIIMQNTSHNILLFCTPTWPSYHVIENHLFLASRHISIWIANNQGRFGIVLQFSMSIRKCPVALLVNLFITAGEKYGE